MAKMRVITEDQYEKIRYLARRLIPKKIIAEVIDFSEAGFYKRLKRDAALRNALQDSIDKGIIALYVSQYRTAIDHYQTICKTCGKISEGEFLESCPYCDKLDPLEKGNHNSVKHRYIPADVGMLIHMGKHHLGQTDRSLIEVRGDETHPLVFKNLSGAEVDRKLKAMLPVLARDYGFELVPITLEATGCNAGIMPDYT
jgi:hypothetical protein